MGSRFAGQFRRAGGPSLVHQFGEAIVYYPRGSTQRARPINAIVERVEDIVEGAVVQVIRCSVRDDATLGILATEINDGRDEVAIALTQNGPLQRREITKMDNDSNGMVRFRVR